MDTKEESIIVNNSTRRAYAWIEPFLASLRINCNVTLACKACQIDYSTPYMHKQRHPEFAIAWEEAVKEGADALEAEAWRRAVEGTERPVYQGGTLVGHVREYSDTLMTVLLKGHKPEKYKERVSTEHSGTIMLDALRDRQQDATERDKELDSNPELKGLTR